MCHVCSTPTQYFVGPSLKSLPRDRIGLPWLRLFVRPLSFQQHAVLASQIKPRPLPSNHATIRQFRKWASDIKAFPAFQLPKKFNVSWQSRFTDTGPHSTTLRWSLFWMKGIRPTTSDTLTLKIYFNIILSITHGFQNVSLFEFLR